LSGGGVVAVQNNTRIRVHANRPYNFNRIQILEGTAVVVSGGHGPLVSCRNNAQLSSAGVFRFDVEPARADGTSACRFRVFEGAAAVPLVSVIAALRAGESMALDPTCGDMVPTMTFAPEKLDDFDRWSRQHAATSAR
jgi:hypothetical protein